MYDWHVLLGLLHILVFPSHHHVFHLDCLFFVRLFCQKPFQILPAHHCYFISVSFLCLKVLCRPVFILLSSDCFALLCVMVFLFLVLFGLPVVTSCDLTLQRSITFFSSISSWGFAFSLQFYVLFPYS